MSGRTYFPWPVRPKMPSYTSSTGLPAILLLLTHCIPFSPVCKGSRGPYSWPRDWMLLNRCHYSLHFSLEGFFFPNFNPLLWLQDLFFQAIAQSTFLFLALASNEIRIICLKSMNSSAIQQLDQATSITDLCLMAWFLQNKTSTWKQ